MKEVLKHIGSLVLLGLLLFKLSAFHVYEEHESLNGQENHCEFCLLVIENQQLDFLDIPFPVIDDILLEPIYQGKITTIDIAVNLSLSKKEQLPRPPPAIL